MNCFPCKGPACNACEKYDRINAMVERDNDIRCLACGGRVDLSTGLCRECGSVIVAAPGSSESKLAGGSYHLR